IVVRLRDAEVEHFQKRRPIGATREEKIRWLEIAMHDAECVCLNDRFACLKDVVDSFTWRKRSTRTNEVREIEAFEKLHHDVRRLVRVLVLVRASSSLHIEHTHDVLVLDLGGEARLAKKSLEMLIIHRGRR